ncbi:MAG: hypothetical protein H7A04_10320 [Pseudomonadales bacterium]|nr:hypothetical protein [Pseudomonadales bacterium]
MEQIVAAIIGGFLAAGTGWFLQTRQESSRLNRLKKMLLTGICDDLRSSVETYSRVQEEWDKSQTVWFTTLNEIRESRQTYLKNRDHLVLLDDESLRQKIFRYYQKSGDQLNLLENNQRRKYEIVAKLNELVRDIQLRDSTLPREDAAKQAIALMSAEDQELIGINNALPGAILKVRDFRADAKELLNEIQSNHDA